MEKYHAVNREYVIGSNVYDSYGSNELSIEINHTEKRGTSIEYIYMYIYT